MPDPRTIATISANGQIFTGWKSLTVRRPYGDMVSFFQFTCSDAHGEAAKLLPGAQCEIKLGGQTVLTGTITTRGFAYDAETHDVVIAGKSLTSPVTTSKAGWQTVEIEATVAGWFRPDGKLWSVTDNATLLSPMAFPVGSHRMQLGVQETTFSQSSQGEGTTTTLNLVLPQFLTPVGHASVQSDAAGNIVSSPGPAQPVPPDTGS